MAEEQKIIEQEGFAYFRSDRKMIKVKYDDILFIESMKDYVKVVRSGDKPLLVKQSISSLESMLPANQFVRVHRSFIVSIQKITATEKPVVVYALGNGETWGYNIDDAVRSLIKNYTFDTINLKKNTFPAIYRFACLINH